MVWVGKIFLAWFGLAGFSAWFDVECWRRFAG